MTNWPVDPSLHEALSDALSDAIIRFKPQMRLPRYNFDGSEIKSAEQLAAAANIPLLEAQKRLAGYSGEYQSKDVSSDSASHVCAVGVGTVVERGNAIASGRRKKRKKRD